MTLAMASRLPLNLPTATILFQAPPQTRDLLAQAIGALNNTIEFVDLYDPIMDGIAEIFFTGGLVDNRVDIKPDTEMPLESEEYPHVSDWRELLSNAIRHAYGSEGLAKLALHRLSESPLTQDRLLFLNVNRPSEACAIIAEYGSQHTLVIKCGAMSHTPFSTPTIQLASSDPSEWIAQLRREIGEEVP
jgi:hypothetical protein